MDNKSGNLKSESTFTKDFCIIGFVSLKDFNYYSIFSEERLDYTVMVLEFLIPGMSC